MTIRWRSVLLGGLAAGLIINLSGISLAHFVLGPEYVKAFQSHMPSEPGVLMFATHLGIRFLFGLLAVFIYAGFRPRFGARPRAAVIAAVTIWLAAVLPLMLSLNQFGILVGWRLWVTLVWSVAEIVVATLVGAWLYREPLP